MAVYPSYRGTSRNRTVDSKPVTRAVVPLAHTQFAQLREDIQSGRQYGQLTKGGLDSIEHRSKGTFETNAVQHIVARYPEGLTAFELDALKVTLREAEDNAERFQRQMRSVGKAHRVERELRDGSLAGDLAWDALEPQARLLEASEQNHVEVAKAWSYARTRARTELGAQVIYWSWRSASSDLVVLETEWDAVRNNAGLGSAEAPLSDLTITNHLRLRSDQLSRVIREGPQRFEKRTGIPYEDYSGATLAKALDAIPQVENEDIPVQHVNSAWTPWQ
jgi:hypothetical protein